jgi:hypothetical protein
MMFGEEWLVERSWNWKRGKRAKALKFKSKPERFISNLASHCSIRGCFFCSLPSRLLSIFLYFTSQSLIRSSFLCFWDNHV